MLLFYLSYFKSKIITLWGVWPLNLYCLLSVRMECIKGKRSCQFLSQRSLGLLEQELGCAIILDKRKFCISFERHLKNGLTSYLWTRLSVLWLLLYCCCCFKEKKNWPDGVRNFLIKLILNLPENIIFQISEMWTLVAFSILHPVSFCFFLKVHCGVNSEREQCYFPWRVQKILKPALSKEPELVCVCTGMAAWGHAPRSHREAHHSTCDRRLEASAVLIGEMLKGNCQVTYVTENQSVWQIQVSCPMSLCFQSSPLAMVLSQGAPSITWGAC